MPAANRFRAFLTAILASAAVASLFAYDPPAGGVLTPILPSAAGLSSGLSVTGVDAPWADRLNPAASAGQQRPALEADLTGIFDFGGSQGFGGGGGLGISVPLPWAVLGGSLRLLSTPSTMSDLPLGTFGELRGSIAKDLFPDFYVGAGLGLELGGNGGLGWGAGLDLGVMQKLGDIGFMKELRWGAVLSGIGKGYQATSPAAGEFGTAASEVQPPFTLSAGIRGLWLKTDDWKGSLGLDLSLPTFQDLGVNFSTGLTWKDMVGLRMAWGFSARELGSSVNRSLLPSFGITATIPLQQSSKDSLLAKQGFDNADLKPYLSFSPLYGSLWAIGAGAVLPLGSADKLPPVVSVTFPYTGWGAPAGSADWKPGQAAGGKDAKGPAYISPNNDGVQDSLAMPISITDRRYILSWTMTVRDASGTTVRKIANKELRPETQGFKGLWASLTYVKKGVPIPEKLEWNGVADSGQVVPDGAYSVTVEAVDDNGNQASAGPFPVVVRNTAPTLDAALTLTPAIFSPGGESSKTSLLVKLSGSLEDRWTIRVLDIPGKAVRSLEFADAAPSDWTWDGKGDDGKIVPDGVYSFVISTTDRAGNSVLRKLDNIVVDTQQPPINLIIDLASFSPAGATKKVETLFPSVPVKAGIVAWRLSIIDAGKAEKWFLTGADGASLKDRVPFDGHANDGGALPEGRYQGLLSVTYQNGYAPTALSPLFLLDLTAPSGTVTADRAAFNPAGSAGQNVVRFLQKGTKDADWKGELLDATGAVRRTWTFAPLPDPTLEWDGLDGAGKILPDGLYLYRMTALDAAGNTFSSQPAQVSLDTEKKAARLFTDQKAFSGIPASARPTLAIGAQVQANDRVKSWTLEIAAADATGAPQGPALRSWSGTKAIPDSFTWDALGDNKLKVPDGRYAARLSATYSTGETATAQAGPFTLDSVAPQATATAAPLLFSPADSSRSRITSITQDSAPGDDWDGRLVAADGTVVRAWNWKGRVQPFTWDGTDKAGNLVPDGSYRYELSSTDAAGNRGQALIPAITVDKRPVQVFVTASAAGISPLGSEGNREVSFNLIVKLREGIDTWRFALVDKDGAEKSVFSGKGGDVPARLTWDGRDATGAYAQGEYVGVFTVDYLKGDRAEARTGKILVNTDGPQAQVKLTPDLFSPDNDGSNDELTIAIGVKDSSDIADWSFQVYEQAVVEGAKPDAAPQQRLFKSWGGSGSPAASIIWDGRSDKGELVESATDYPFVFTVRDVLGAQATVKGAISVDVLVIRVGDKLKIMVPSIVFRANFPDFVGLDKATSDRNAQVVLRIAQILNKFKDYKIRIEGNANSAAKIAGLGQAAIDKEEQTELIPLSLGRAELIKKLLVADGVDPSRITTAGMGASQPVVDFLDAQNRWKNRRVEFILIKNQ